MKQTCSWFLITLVIAISCRRDTQEPTVDEAGQLTLTQMQSVQDWVTGSASKQSTTERARRDSVAKLLQWGKHKVFQLKDGRLMLSVPLLGETDGVTATRAIFKLNKKEGTVNSARIARIKTGGNVERALRQYYNHDMKGLSGDVEVTEHTLSNRLATGASYLNGKLRKWGRITQQTATAAGLKMGFDPTPMVTNGDCTHYFYIVSITYEDGTSYVIGSYYLYSICFDGGGDGGGGGTGGGGEGQVIANEADPRKIHTPTLYADRCKALWDMWDASFNTDGSPFVENVVALTTQGSILLPNYLNNASHAVFGDYPNVEPVEINGRWHVKIAGDPNYYELVGFAHTHPSGSINGSVADYSAANKYRVPVFTVSKNGIGVVEPNDVYGGDDTERIGELSDLCAIVL